MASSRSRAMIKVDNISKLLSEYCEGQEPIIKKQINSQVKKYFENNINLKNLYDAANSFLSNLYRIYLQEHTHVRVGNNFWRIFSKKQSQETLSKILQLEVNFANAVDTFLDRTIYLAAVKDDGSVLLGGNAAIRALYNKVTSRSSSTRVSLGNIEKRLADFKEKNVRVQRIQQLINASANNKRDVYMEALRRSSKTASQETNNSSWKSGYYYASHYNDQLNMNTRYTIPNINKGHIAEGYLRAVLFSEQQMRMNGGIDDLITYIYNSSSPIPKSIGEPKLNKGAANIEIQLYTLAKFINVDFASGAAQGDISLGPDGKIQFQVKKNTDASSGSIGPYISQALLIVYFYKKGNANEELYKALLTNPNMKIDEVIHALTTEMGQNISQIFKSWEISK